MTMKNLLAGAVLVAAAVSANAATADDLGAAATSLCEKVKTCALQQMNQQQMTPQMRQMIEPSLESMCASMNGQMAEVPQGHELYKPAVACMRSMAQQSCSDIMNAAQNMTPACKDYENKVRNMGGADAS